jgi:hypothetical protein
VKYTPELRERAAKLRANGLSYREIGLKINVPKQSVMIWFKTPEQLAANSRRSVALKKTGRVAGGRCTRCDNPTITVPADGLCGMCIADDALVAAGRGPDVAA